MSLKQLNRIFLWNTMLKIRNYSWSSRNSRDLKVLANFTNSHLQKQKPKSNCTKTNTLKSKDRTFSKNKSPRIILEWRKEKASCGNKKKEAFSFREIKKTISKKVKDEFQSKFNIENISYTMDK